MLRDGSRRPSNPPILLDPSPPVRYRDTHLGLPTIHRLLVLLPRLEDQHVDHVDVRDPPVSLKVGSFLFTDHARRDVECVKGDNLGSLWVVINTW